MMFALQRKADKLLMPDFKGHAGGTYVDPDKRDTHTGTPRLFTTKKGASEALRWWAKGRVRKEMSGGFSVGLDSLDPPEVTGLRSEAVAGRNADDWEIVSVEVVVTQEETCKT